MSCVAKQADDCEGVDADNEGSGMLALPNPAASPMAHGTSCTRPACAAAFVKYSFKTCPQQGDTALAHIWLQPHDFLQTWRMMTRTA